jgi:glycosyltransferase involved in cell wall biosynthesis
VCDPRSLPEYAGRMTRPAAVMISPEAPYPMHGGGAIRTASLLHYLVTRYDVDLILFQQAGDTDPALSLPPGLVRDVRTVTLPFHSRQPLAWLLRNGRRWIVGTPPLFDRFSGDRFSGQEREIESFVKGRYYEVGVIEHFWCAPYVTAVAPLCECTILDLHNVESALHASCSRSDAWPFSLAHMRFERAYQRLERRWLPRFSRLLSTSEEDAGRLRQLAPTTPITVYRNALPLVSIPEGVEEDVIGFSGNFEYHPNVRAVRYLATELWPRLKNQFPNLKLRLIGKNPGAIGKYIAGIAGIETTGPVEDAITELAKVKVAIVPLLSGSGTRLKILEAWAAARPVVATSIGAEGLGAKPDIDIVLADTAETFVASVAELLGSNERRRRIGCAARHTYEERFTWQAAWQTLQL